MRTFWNRATGHRGQVATSHLRPCRGHPRARVSPSQPQHPSFAADEHRSGRNRELLCSARPEKERRTSHEKRNKSRGLTEETVTQLNSA